MAAADKRKSRPNRRQRMETAAAASGDNFGNFSAARSPRSFIAHLDQTAEQYRDLKRFSYDLLELKPGAAVLELGCGVGNDVRELAALVGPEGLAIGVDSSRELIAEARKRAQNANLELEFIVGNAERLDLARDCFDACRAERLFQHLEDPGRALSEMVRVANPGAVVQVIDRDWGLVAVDAQDRETTRAILNRICDGARNGWIGRQLPALFRASGLRDVRIHSLPQVTRDLPVANRMLDLPAFARHARDEGLVSAKAASAWTEDLKRRHSAGNFLACWVMFVVTGRKKR